MRFDPVTIDPIWAETGPRGEPGQSIIGPPGRDGDSIVGPPGRDGESVRFRGAWFATRCYKPGDMIGYNHSTWACVRENANKCPGPASPYWTLACARGKPGKQGPAGIGQRGRRGVAGESNDPVIPTAFDVPTITGQPIYLTATGASLANASDSVTSAVVGLAQKGGYLTEGQITTNWAPITGGQLTKGAVYYLGTAGMLTTTAPEGAGYSVVCVGRALSSDTLDIEISQPIYLS